MPPVIEDRGKCRAEADVGACARKTRSKWPQSRLGDVPDLRRRRFDRLFSVAADISAGAFSA